MQTSNANQTFNSGDPVWVLLSELSLRDFLSDHDRRGMPAAGYLFKMVRELGMSPECMENITRTLAGFAKEALLGYKPGRVELAGRIRIFCQKKMIEDANSAKPSSPHHTEQHKRPEQIFPDSGVNPIGGWGYFMIERGGDFPTDSSIIPHSDIDLYLYREGE